MSQECQNADCNQPQNCGPNPPEPFVKLWSLTYKMTDEPNYAGMAVVAAVDVRQAIQIFTKDGVHNGKPEAIKIGKIEQIPYPIVPALIMENYIQVFE